MSTLVRDAFIAALTRRAARHQGAARDVLDARLAALAKQVGTPAVAHDAATPLAPRGPLGLLADGLAVGHTPTEPLASEPASPGSQRELATLRHFRGTWSRLFAEQRLRQTLAQVPPQAGPLNSNHLVHRALATMQEVSPAYLQRFVAHVEALLWMERQQAPVSPATARLDKPRKGGRR